MTTAPSEGGAPTETPELRLHPLSVLFELLGVVRGSIVPIIVLLYARDGGDVVLWCLISGGMVPVAVARYRSFRYRIGEDRIVLRTGLLQKTVRDIVFTRIQDVTLHQGVLHRLMNVAEVRLETGGGDRAEEGHMRVLGLADAQQLQRLIRGRESATLASATQAGETPSPIEPAAAAAAAERILLSLPTRELLKLALFSNKGILLVGAGFGALLQLDRELRQTLFKQAGGWLWAHGGERVDDGIAFYILVGIALLALVVALRVLSLVQVLLTYHGFALSGDPHRLSIRRGLLERFNGSLPRGRVQGWTLQQGWLQRKFGRFALRVDVAAVTSGDTESHWQLAPIADEAGIARIIDAVLPAGTWPIQQWRPLHPNAWRREFNANALVLLIPAVLLILWLHAWGLWILLAYPWLWFHAKQWAKHAGYARESGLIAARVGWIRKTWRFAEVRKVQAVYLKQSPFDRWSGMATVSMDTVNAGSSGALAVRRLPLAEAVALYREVSAKIADRARAHPG